MGGGETVEQELEGDGSMRRRGNRARFSDLFRRGPNSSALVCKARGWRAQISTFCVGFEGVLEQ